MPLERANALFLHPLHQDAYAALVQLIIHLRQCQTYADYYDFQQELLNKVLAVQGHRGACTRVLKRLRSGKGVPADAPELRVSGDRNNPATWELEVDVCERIDRQFRSIGDALAWRLFSYDRRVIVAFSRNDPPGPMVGKEGLVVERTFVTDTWRDQGSFVLLHDLTACLRIGDATLFKAIGNDYEAYLYEIKKNPAKKKALQVQQSELAQDAIRAGGQLPGDPEARLVQVNIPYRTHLSKLRDAFTMAATRGVMGMKIPGGRALIAADLRQGYSLWSEEAFLERTGEAQRLALKHAGILDVGNHVFYGSDDLVARSPIHPPWAIFPMSPVACANLIVDMAVYIVTVSSLSLLDALHAEGIRAEWVLPPGQEQLQAGQTILRAYKGTHGIEMRPSDMQRLLLELEDMSTWARTVKALLELDQSSGRPWPYYEDEYRTWA